MPPLNIIVKIYANMIIFEPGISRRETAKETNTVNSRLSAVPMSVTKTVFFIVTRYRWLLRIY